MTPEKRVQNSIVKYFQKLYEAGQCIMIDRRQAGGYSYKKGIPDLYAVVNGIHLEIEVKRPGGKLSPMQEKFRDKCLRLNVFWVCAENVNDVSEIVNYLLTFKLLNHK